MKIKFALGLLVVPVIYLVTGCSSALMISSKYDNSIKTDGNRDDWNESFNFDEDNSISVGFKNDDRNLYIALVTSRQYNVMKILNAGLTIWLESEKNSEKIGIRFPHRNDDNEMPMLRPKNGNRERSPQDMQDMLNKLIVKQDEISVVNEDEFPLYAFRTNAVEGVAGGLGFSMGQFVYELRVPLAGNDSTPFYFNASPGDKIIVEIESGETNRSSRSHDKSPPMDGGMPGGGGMKSGRPGGRIGGDRGSVSEMNKKIDFSAEVDLAVDQ